MSAVARSAAGALLLAAAPALAGCLGLLTPAALVIVYKPSMEITQNETLQTHAIPLPDDDLQHGEFNSHRLCRDLTR